MAALVIGLAGLAAGLTQCRMVTDSAQDARLAEADKSSNCMAACAHAFADAVRAEHDLHVANIHACAGDTTCEAAEDARHEAAMAQIDAGRKDCQGRCHSQGGGAGGR